MMHNSADAWYVLFVGNMDQWYNIICWPPSIAIRNEYILNDTENTFFRDK